MCSLSCINSISLVGPASSVLGQCKHISGPPPTSILAKPIVWKHPSKFNAYCVSIEAVSHELAEEQQERGSRTTTNENSDTHQLHNHIGGKQLVSFQVLLGALIQCFKEFSSQLANLPEVQGKITRRSTLIVPIFISLGHLFNWEIHKRGACALVPANIDGTKVPTRPFDVTDERLRDAAYILQQALNASSVEEEERLWTLVIDKYHNLKAEWVSDIVSRAYGNRGNARSRQGKLEQALQDYDKSISLAPYAVDPVLNRGVVLESLGRYNEASADYEAVLRAEPNDPAAWNNLGNVKAAENEWEEALLDYQKAVQLAPEFSFAAGNYALALYQVGRENEAIRQFRTLLRRYPKFPDIRAALAVSLYAAGLTAEAENNWDQVEDGRYRDRLWVRNTRRWPPRLVNALISFLDLKLPIQN